MKKAYCFLADGFEEVEALAVTDVLHRSGVDVKLVSVTGQYQVESSHGIIIKAHELFENIEDDADLLFLPGGMPGTTNLAGHSGLCEMIKKHNERGGYIAAVCAAPSVLGINGLLKGKKATCYPGFEDKLYGAEVCTADRSKRVVRDGNIITSRGMGTSVELGLELVGILMGEDEKETQALKIQHI